MNVLISGATGLIGTALTEYLEQQGHTVYILHRDKEVGAFYWKPNFGHIYLDPRIHLDAVVNLNGVNIGDKPWSKARKKEILNSRIQSTQLLAEAISKRSQKPSTFVSASAIGFYGDTGDEWVDEQSSGGKNFLTDIAKHWEQSARAANDAGIRTVFIRTGVVLAKQGGALAKMLLPFKLGLGGPIGQGNQYMSWISLEDEIRAIAYLLENKDIEGPVNLTAPNPVTNETFAKRLAANLKRPALLPMPAWLVKLIFGEMGELLLLGSARVKSKVLQDNGFRFHHQQIDDAFAAITGKKKASST
ncbi:TIGR01777 family oxidoreductase [Bermanella sp. R86510]|uniref:TIGR01777 family oxidoreductase n=1 Tax=unclassified Bermanella TaxID=2627862 RepID=UPI0037CA1970